MNFIARYFLKKTIEKEFRKQYIDTGIAESVKVFWDKERKSFGVSYIPKETKQFEDYEILEENDV